MVASVKMSGRPLAGFTVDAFKGFQPATILRQIRRAGVEFAEVTKSVFDNLPDMLRSIGTMKLGFHLPIISEDGFDFSCVNHKKKIDHLIDLLNAHWRDLNLQYVLSHPTENHLFNTDGQVSKSFLFENLSRIEAPVIIENTFESDSFRFEDFYADAQSVLGDKLTGMCFDGPHAFISREDWIGLLESHIEEIRLVHLSDCTRKKDLHLPFGCGGELPVDKILSFLKRQKYTGIVNLELMPHSLTELGPVFKSYLMILKYLDPAKYRRMKIKSYLILPLLHNRFK